jgi:hypothetical protein
MGRIYSVSFTDVAVTAVQDLFQIEAVTVPAIIHAIYVSQITDVGDANAEALTIRIRRVTDALTNVTAEAQMDTGDAVALADLNVNDTTQLVTGAQTLHAEGWNIAMPFVYLPPPELRIVVKVGDALTVDLATAPADSITVNGTMYFEEVGS